MSYSQNGKSHFPVWLLWTITVVKGGRSDFVLNKSNPTSFDTERQTARTRACSRYSHTRALAMHCMCCGNSQKLEPPSKTHTHTFRLPASSQRLNPLVVVYRWSICRRYPRHWFCCNYNALKIYLEIQSVCIVLFTLYIRGKCVK